jgi:thiamine biosynthesis lipoprotein
MGNDSNGIISSNTDWKFDAIGTHWNISLPGLSEERAEYLVTRTLTRIAQFDRAYSRFREDSLVTEMSRAAGTYDLPEDAKQLLDLYEFLYEITEGKFTPLIGQVLSVAVYDE